jgi:SAM-dependent methyltransferase
MRIFDLTGAPSEWVVEHTPLIRNGGRVLDLACGYGRHAAWLAAQGYQVDAVDRNAQALAGMLGIENINVIVADIECGEWPATEQKYDAIIVSRYLYRPILVILAQMLNVDGVLIYETFMLGHERYGKPSTPDYLLLQDELQTVYAPLLQIYAFEQGEVKSGFPAVMQRICAVKNITLTQYLKVSA